MGNLARMPFLIAIAAALKVKNLMKIMSASAPAAGTPGIPHSMGHSRTKAKTINDGHWHMKLHRSR